jgi:hypothetical protein
MKICFKEYFFCLCAQIFGQLPTKIKERKRDWHLAKKLLSNQKVLLFILCISSRSLKVNRFPRLLTTFVALVVDVDVPGVFLLVLNYWLLLTNKT